MKRTQIQLTEEQTEQLDEVARERGVSRSELIRRAVNSWLETHDVRSAERVKERAKEAVGAFASGDEGVSQQHDAHLENAYGS